VHNNSTFTSQNTLKPFRFPQNPFYGCCKGFTSKWHERKHWNLRFVHYANWLLPIQRKKEILFSQLFNAGILIINSSKYWPIVSIWHYRTQNRKTSIVIVRFNLIPGRASANSYNLDRFWKNKKSQAEILWEMRQRWNSWGSSVSTQLSIRSPSGWIEKAFKRFFK
jgi:hypothetical protein